MAIRGTVSTVQKRQTEVLPPPGRAASTPWCSPFP